MYSKGSGQCCFTAIKKSHSLVGMTLRAWWEIFQKGVRFKMTFAIITPAL
ncbi:hypothetical protein SAMN03159488_01599 [Pseudomonas sp. NFIX10]|nr:hypothetical protein SAMN03159488_01599 [Pseudomonas sp. NFIX10]SFE59760.1 hypothetical protein SAMN03159367_01599 [Pseudomonas sp. NFACC06-1]